MKCGKQSFWRAYADEDSTIEGPLRLEAGRHLKDCEHCDLMLGRIVENRETAQRLLDGAPADHGGGARAFDETIVSHRQGRLPGKPLRMIAGLSAALFIVALIAAPVGTFAAEFLQLFRVERFEAVSIDPEAMIDFDPSRLGAFDISEPTYLENVGLEEAVRITGLAVALPAKLESGAVRGDINASGKGEISLTFDLEKFQQYLDEHDISGISLPANLDGRRITGTIPPTVFAEYRAVSDSHDDGPPQLLIGQAGLPEIQAPPGVDFDQIKDELLRLPIVPAGIRDQLNDLTDWKRTLPVPYPAGDVEPEKVTVMTTGDGLYFTADDGGRVLMWIEDETAHALAAPDGSSLSRADLFAIAGSLDG